MHKTIIPINDPQRGDIIVFEFPEDPSKDFIKRVIGLPGDTVEIRNKKLVVNGKTIEDSHAVHKDSKIFPGRMQPRDNLGPITVPERQTFCHGRQPRFFL